MTRSLLLLVPLALAFVACGKSQTDSPNSPIALCNQLRSQAVVISCESVDITNLPGPDKPLTHVRAQLVEPSKGDGSRSSVDLFSFTSKEMAERFISSRIALAQRMQEVGAAKAREAGFHPKPQTINNYKSRSGTICAITNNASDAQVAEQLNRIKTAVEGAP